MTLVNWLKIEASRAPGSFDSDLSKNFEKVWASNMASFRGQEIFPMVLGDGPRYTKEVLRKKMTFFFRDFNFGWTFQRLLLLCHDKTIKRENQLNHLKEINENPI